MNTRSVWVWVTEVINMTFHCGVKFAAMFKEIQGKLKQV